MFEKSYQPKMAVLTTAPLSNPSDSHPPQENDMRLSLRVYNLLLHTPLLLLAPSLLTLLTLPLRLSSQTDTPPLTVGE